MIGSDEFNYRGSRTTGHSTGDSSDVEYIETFLASYNHTTSKQRLLIDIVCPQPQSRRRDVATSTSSQSTPQAARTNSTSGWKK
jgi:hypothetical protein